MNLVHRVARVFGGHIYVRREESAEMWYLLSCGAASIGPGKTLFGNCFCDEPNCPVKGTVTGFARATGMALAVDGEQWELRQTSTSAGVTMPEGIV